MHLIGASLVFLSSELNLPANFGEKPQFLKENWGFFMGFDHFTLFYCTILVQLLKNQIALPLAKKNPTLGKVGQIKRNKYGESYRTTRSSKFRI